LLLNPALKAAQVEDIDKLMWGAVKYGKFIAAIIKFIVIAFVLFLIVKSVNSLKKKEEAPAAPAEPSSTDKLLTEIRDALQK
jgi:large conductance mechanosensitive channel